MHGAIPRAATIARLFNGLASLSSIPTSRWGLQLHKHIPTCTRGSRLFASARDQPSRNKAAVVSILSSRPEKADLQHVLIGFPRYTWLEEHRSSVPILILLMTPSFARSTQQDTNFWELLMEHVFKRHMNSAQGEQSYDVVVAVVDKIPVPYMRPGYQKHDAGFEGFSMMLGLSDKVAPALWDETNSVATSTASNDHITFTFGPPPSWMEFLDPIEVKVDVPLANTVFETGKPYTMSASRFSYSRGTKALIERKRLEDRTFHFRMEPTGVEFPKSASFAIHIPLKPLTPARKVVRAMGNIVSQLRREGETIRASTELEYYVPEYFRTINAGRSPKKIIPVQPVDVWALVIPGSKKPRFSLTSQNRKMWHWRACPHPNDLTNLYLRDALSKGARLHRVLSGGGGWGDKAGLVSLDYKNTTPIGQDLSSSLDHISTLKNNYGLDEILGSVVRSGDFIQFFVAPPDLTPVQLSQVRDISTIDSSKLSLIPQGGKKGQSKLPSLEAMETDFRFTSEFGTSPADSVEYFEDQNASRKRSKTERGGLKFFSGFFGALSQRGISLAYRRNSERIADGDDHAQTTVDVPYSKFKIATWAQKDRVYTKSGLQLFDTLDRLESRGISVDPASTQKTAEQISTGEDDKKIEFGAHTIVPSTSGIILRRRRISHGFKRPKRRRPAMPLDESKWNSRSRPSD